MDIDIFDLLLTICLLMLDFTDRQGIAARLELGGHPIAAGDKVVMYFISADHDDAKFPNPYRFDLARDDNEHMAFGGGGPHFCLGAHLARREITILFEELLKRTSHIEQSGDPAYSVLGIGNPILVSLGKLPVRLKGA